MCLADKEIIFSGINYFLSLEGKGNAKKGMKTFYI